MLQIIVNGRRPSFFSEMEDNLKFWKMEDDLNCFVIKEDDLYFFGKRKTTSFSNLLQPISRYSKSLNVRISEQSD